MVKNSKNIKARTDKAHGNIEKIINTLNERPLGKYDFRAFRLMREGLLLAGLLSNSEGWINLTKLDIEKLQKPDTILQRKVLASSVTPSKAFTMLELGIIPIKYIIMKKTFVISTLYFERRKAIND